MKNKFHVALTEDKEKIYLKNAKVRARTLIWQLGELALSNGNRYSERVSHLALMKETTSVENPFTATKMKPEKWQSPSLCHFWPPGLLSCSFCLQILFHLFHSTFQHIIWLKREKQIHDILRLS